MTDGVHDSEMYKRIGNIENKKTIIIFISYYYKRNYTKNNTLEVLRNNATFIKNKDHLFRTTTPHNTYPLKLPGNFLIAQHFYFFLTLLFTKYSLEHFQCQT